MKRIIIHWTAGSYTETPHEKECYHFLIGYNKQTGKAYCVNGNFKPEDNENCYDGRYAAHTGGGNTGSIGISVCGMAGFKSAKEIGKYPITRAQMEMLFKTCAGLCKAYKIPIGPATVLTHYEFGKQNPKTSSAGKIDINFLPYEPKIKPEDVGDFIRGKVKWYFEKK